MRSLIIVCCLMLAGCAGGALSGADTVSPSVPALDPQDAAVCTDPGVPAGVNSDVIIGRTRAALGVCTRKHGRVVRQYNGVRTGLAAKKK